MIKAFSADLGQNLSEADMAMVRTAAALTLKSEQLQAALAAGENVDGDALIRLAGTTRRALAAISAKAIERKPGQTLQEYLSAKAAKAAELEADDEADGAVDDDGDDNEAAGS